MKNCDNVLMDGNDSMKQDMFQDNLDDNTASFNAQHSDLVQCGDVADANMISHEDSEKKTKRWFRERNRMDEIQ